MENEKRNSISKEPDSWALDWLKELSFMDDILFRRAFRERPDLAQHLINGILSKPDLSVVSMNTQDALFAINTKGVVLDCLCTDSDGNIYDIEVQTDVSKALGRRARAYGSIIDSSIFKRGQDYKELPDRYIIFITREDYLRNGRQVTVLAMRDEEGKSEDGSGMYHVYGCINNRDENTEAGRVLADMGCTRAESMYYDGYRERMEDFKVRKEGVREMTGIMEQIRNEGLEQGLNQGMQKGMQKGAKQTSIQIAGNMVRLGFASEQIAQATGLSASEVAEITKGIKN